ncbi:MAG: cell division control protein Cdc6, partial [Thermoplasmata archaeon]
AKKSSTGILTQRRVANLISEMDMMGLVSARVKSFGRGGRTREILVSVPLLETKRILEKDPMLEPVKGYRLKMQSTLM